MIKFTKIILFFSLLFFTTHTKLDANETAKYFGSQEYQKLLYNLGVYWDRNILQVQTHCTSKYTLNPLSFAIIKPLKFSDTNTLIEGIWTFRYKFTRCKESIIYNALNIMKAGSKLKTIPLVPGTTNCDPILLKDAYQGLYANLSLHNKQNSTTCKTVRVLNTKVTKPQTANDKAWEEKWTVLECEKKVETTFCFSPSQKGGTDWSIGKCKR